jgi:hypothetical protein
MLQDGAIPSYTGIDLMYYVSCICILLSRTLLASQLSLFVNSFHKFHTPVQLTEPRR